MACPFCNAEVIQTQKICETEKEFVIHNIRPINKGQCIVIPKRHVTNIRDLPDDEVGSLLKTIKSVSSKLKEYLNPAGFNYCFNEGEYAGQSIDHLHFHILPRFENDGLMKIDLFYKKPEKRKGLTTEELLPEVEEFRNVFKMLNK